MTDQLVPHDAAATIAAGGVVMLGVKLPEDQRTSPVTARRYEHPAIAGKTFVRLEPDAVAAGVDAEMAAFGFTLAPASKPVSPLGQVRYRTLGFPAWALVHEPKKAKAALDVTEDLRKAKRMVAAKPGHAKEAFEKIAKQLQRTAPQFLPSFWEECGRVVADQASSTMAAQCFERARQAERAYKLKVNAEDGDAVFVEFALLGALSAKTLSQYARDLKKSEGGKEAYRRFRAIVVKRALGGMPPWSGMGKDVRALADEAGLDVDREDDALAAELIEAPGIGKAPTEFWTTYRESLIRLAKQNADVRARLRALWPEPRGGTRESQKAFTGSWIEILDEVGALADLPDDGPPCHGAEGSGPRAGALGAWISKLLKYAGTTPRILQLLRDVAPRLVALGQPIAVITPRSRWGSDLNLDLCELALELGVPLVDPEDGDDFYPESMSCDPVRTAAEPRYGKKLVEAVASMMGESEHEHRMRGKQGFVAARRQWIEERLVALGKAALPEVKDTLDTIEGKTTAETFLPYQDLHARLAATDLSRALAYQLRGGIADEFGWPAYEEAFDKLGGEIQIGGAFPVMTIWNKTKVIALGATGVIAEHDLVYKPKDHKVEHALYLGNQFLIDLDPDKGWQHIAYWSDAPKKTFDLKVGFRSWGGDLPTFTTLPDGRITLGDKAFSPGDSELHGSEDYLTDGTTFWHTKWEDRQPKLREYDPTKGAEGRFSWPTFIDGWHKDGWRIDAGSCVLVKAPDGLGTSPLGMTDGLLGLKVREPIEGDGYEVERIDGVTWRGSVEPFALVTFPGDAAPRPIRTTGADNKRYPGGSGPGVYLYSTEGELLAELGADDWAARGWGKVHVPPGAMWDFLTPRDPAGSAALRAIDAATARAILDVAKREVEAQPDAEGRKLTETEAAVRARLPAVTNAAVVRGIAGIADRAAELAIRLDAIAAERSKDNADPSGEGLTAEGTKIRKLAAAMTAGRSTKIPDFDIELRDWLTHGRAMAALALSPIGHADERRKARDVVRALAGTMFADDLSKLRLMKIETPDDYDDPYDWNDLVIAKKDGSVFAIHASDDWALELSSDGTWRAPPTADGRTWNIDEETRLERGIGTEWARGYLELPDAPVAWDPEIANRLAARADLTVPEATLLYLGCPGGWAKDFLGKQKREVVGLKMGEADAARTTFKELDDDAKWPLFTRAVPEDARLLATPLADGGFVDGLGDAWRAKFGKRVKIPQDLIAKAKKDFELDDSYLPAFAGDDDAWFFKPDVRPLTELGGWRDNKGLTPDAARELLAIAAWLFVARPVGCKIRARLGPVLKKVRAVLDDKRVVWKLDDLYVDDEDAKGKARRQAIVDMVGGDEIKLPKHGDEEPVAARDDGAIVMGLYKSNIAGGFRPAKLDGAARKKAETFATALHDEETGGDPLVDIKLAALLRSDGVGAMIERVNDTDVPEGSFEANPLASAKKLVGKVVKEHGISEDAAALYLQMLALAEPTQRNICEWNGWTPKQYKAAATELAKKKLVVEGKRERAGREIFIKGGYSKGDGKNLPMEEWKLPFYSVLQRHLPTEPCHLLFARAWKRVEDGDGPN